MDYAVEEFGGTNVDDWIANHVAGVTSGNVLSINIPKDHVFIFAKAYRNASGMSFLEFTAHSKEGDSKWKHTWSIFTTGTTFAFAANHSSNVCKVKAFLR